MIGQVFNSPVQVACVQGVLWSSPYCCLLLDWVARCCVGLCGNASLRECLRNPSFLPNAILANSSISVCVCTCSCMRFDIAHHRSSAPRSFRSSACVRNLNDLLFFGVLRFFRFFMASVPLEVLQCPIVTARDALRVSGPRR